jgi:hypothetical protein
VKRGDPAESSYVLIAPGAKVDRKVDISRSYPIDQPGDYTATIKADLHDAFAVAGNSKQAPRRRGQLERHPLPPVSVRSRSSPTARPTRRTARPRAKRRSRLEVEGQGEGPGFNGGTPGPADAVVAHDNAQYLRPRCPAADTETASTNSLYQDWLGRATKAATTR